MSEGHRRRRINPFALADAALLLLEYCGPDLDRTFTVNDLHDLVDNPRHEPTEDPHVHVCRTFEPTLDFDLSVEARIPLGYYLTARVVGAVLSDGPLEVLGEEVKAKEFAAFLSFDDRDGNSEYDCSEEWKAIYEDPANAAVAEAAASRIMELGPFLPNSPKIDLDAEVKRLTEQFAGNNKKRRTV